VDTGLDCVLLGWKAERIEPHRVKYVRTAHPVVSGEDVGSDVTEWMTDMETRTRRVREHINDVHLGLGGVEPLITRVRHAIDPLVSPRLL
jgi:hypothetical protein